MQVTCNASRLVGVSRAPSFLSSDRFLAPPDARIIEASHHYLHQWRHHTSFLSRFIWSSGRVHGDSLTPRSHIGQYSMSSMMAGSASFSSDASSVEGSPTEAVKEVYDKMLQSVKARTMPPNAQLWSLIEQCANSEDIKLLFDILQNLRTFRLSNLRMHSDFNANLCREIIKACVRVGDLDFGKKALWKLNVYGLSPSIGCAHNYCYMLKSIMMLTSW